MVDIITEEVIQEGTPVSQTNMNHMDDGIWQNRETIILHDSQIADAQREIKVLKDATLNNMVNNVFLINFVSVTSVAIASGIYDPVARKIYASTPWPGRGFMWTWVPGTGKWFCPSRTSPGTR